MSNSSGTVFVQGLRQGDPWPLWDEMTGGNKTEHCASELLELSSIRFAVFPTVCLGRKAGAGSLYEIWSFNT